MTDVSDITLRPLVDLAGADQMRILEIRNQEAVRKNMYTSHMIPEAEHLAWIESLRSNRRTRFFAVFFKGEIIGGVSLNAISETDRRADWAFYLDAATQGKGLGALLEYKFLDYAFTEAGLEKLNCEVLAFNEPVVRMHKRFGFTEEGVRRRHIERDGETHDVVLLGILKEEWLSKRDDLKVSR